jgi:hypothetical protein
MLDISKNLHCHFRIVQYFLHATSQTDRATMPLLTTRKGNTTFVLYGYRKQHSSARLFVYASKSCKRGRALLGNVVHQKCANGTTVVGTCDGTVPLLSGCVPNLRLDGFAIDLQQSRAPLRPACWARRAKKKLLPQIAAKLLTPNRRQGARHIGMQYLNTTSGELDADRGLGLQAKFVPREPAEKV